MNAERHPGSQTLALFAGGDMELWPLFRVWWHARKCAACRTELARFRAVRERTREDALDFLAADSLEWERLEAEMKANVRLGLAAGAIVDRPEAVEPELPPTHRWQVAVVFASLAVVLASGWYLRRPERHLMPELMRVEAPVIIEERDAGIGIQDQEGTMTLLRPSDHASTVAVDYGVGARTQYVDGDTGQVTIHQVYLDE